MKYLLLNLGSFLCIAFAGLLAYKGDNDNWGWFLFVALLLYCIPNET